MTVQPVLPIKQAAKPWALPRTPRRVKKDDIPVLRWPGDAPIGSPAADHHIRTIIESFLASYRKALQGFFEWWGSDGQAEPLTLPLLRTYETYLVDTVEPRTVNFYLATLRSFYSWKVDQGEFPWNPMDEIRSLRIPKAFVRDSLSEDEIRQLLQVMPRDGATQKQKELALRDYAMAVLWCAVGLRSIELARAQRQDLDFDEGHHLLRIHGKGQDMAGKPVVIEPWVLAPVQAYLDLHDQWHQPDAQGHARPRYPDHPLFCWARGPGSYRSRQDNPAVTRSCRSVGVRVIQNMMRTYLGKAELLNMTAGKTTNLRRITPHSLRHSAATIAIEHGAPLHQRGRTSDSRLYRPT